MPPPSSRTSFNTKSPTIKRILQESRELSLLPDPTLHAAPLESNLFEWHFTLAGPPSTPYSNGIYHGRIILPPTYPLRPPSFRFLTPSGRFEVNREICLSISGHHEETWQPAWGIRTALCAIRAFMEGEAKGQVGGLDMGEEGRERLARESRSWTCSGCGGRRNEDVLKEVEEEASKKEKEEGRADEKGPDIVPEELRLAYRDELSRPAVFANAPLPVASASNSPSSAPLPPAPTSPSLSTSALLTPSISSPALSTPVPPTPTLSLPAPARTVYIPPPQHLHPSQAVPAWVDKAIFGIIVSLVAMAIKKILL